MAYTSSGTLSVGQTYNLGEYALRLIVTSESSEGITSVQCNCSKGTEHAQRGFNQDITIGVKSWRVEANGTTADVYARVYREAINTSPLVSPIPTAGGLTAEWYDPRYGGSTTTWTYTYQGGSGVCTAYRGEYKNAFDKSASLNYIFASSSSGVTIKRVSKSGSSPSQEWSALELNSRYTRYGKTVYYHGSGQTSYYSELKTMSVQCNGGEVVTGSVSNGLCAWAMMYGDGGVDEEKLVARFAIDLEDAGGGIGGDWDEPGDTGEASTTLEVTVTGALSGRHNDPLNDTSYHYTPADQDAATVYGSGGDGGHGGGGGAGASTVIIYKIATERAGNTEETAIAKRHGYGSGGGKGGAGAGGCILVYY